MATAYMLLFAGAAAACFTGATVTYRPESSDVRRGFIGFLTLSGAWSTIQMLGIAASRIWLKTALYTFALVFGFSTVFAWLYFCSAYTGRRLHRERSARYAAVVLFAAVVSLKLTNPWHGLYFDTTLLASPFPHLAVNQGALHWVVTTLSYGLAAVGFYFLYDLYDESGSQTTNLSVLSVMTLAPVTLNVTGAFVDAIPEMFFEPLGVGLFALGVAYTGQRSLFNASRIGRAQLLERLSVPVILVDAGGVVRAVNPAACDELGVSDAAVGTPLEDRFPGVADAIEDGTSVLEHSTENDRRVYQVRVNQVGAGSETLGRSLQFADITEARRRTDEVRRQNEQFQELAAGINHELRNSLSIIEGYLETVQTNGAFDADAPVSEQIGIAVDAAEEMVQRVDDLGTLAKLGGAVTDVTECRVSSLTGSVAEKQSAVDVSVAPDGTLLAEKGRFARLLERLLSYSEATDATTARIELTGDGFRYLDDGTAVAKFDTEALLTYGEAVPHADAGSLLPTARVLAQAHGWTMEVEDDAADGLHVEMTGVEVRDREPDDESTRRHES